MFNNEYKVLQEVSSANIQKIMNELGMQGWHLVSFERTNNDPYCNGWLAVMERSTKWED